MKTKEDVVQEFRIQSIQDATMRVIARKGMSSATMQEIADEAGVAKGTIYLYFRDRDELVEKTFDTAMTQLMSRIDAALDAHPTFEEKIRAVMSAKLAFFSENREFFRLYLSLRMPEGTPERQRRQRKTCQPQYRQGTHKLAAVIEQAIERGELRRLDPMKLAIFITEGSTAIILERLTQEVPGEESADVDLITGLIVDGARKRS
jgi:AcrR family transcriptional regulator